MLSAAEVRALLIYDPETGIFVWKKKPSPRVHVGARAGHQHHKGYRRISVRRTLYAEHRLAWVYQTGEWPPNEVDHIDGNRSNNRIGNLRLASKSQNQANRLANKNNSHGFKGVTRHKKGRKFTGKWAARIGRDRKYLGLFETPEEAHAAYVAEAELRYGNFTRTV